MKYRSLISLFVFATLFAIACQPQAQNLVDEVESTSLPEPSPTMQIEDSEIEAEQEAAALVDDAEPGEPLTVLVQVVDGSTGEALPEAELYVRQTDDAGLYQEAADGVPRIHGRLLSDTTGTVQFHTILPGRYPDDPTATRHIHLSVTAAGYEPLERVMLFDNDPYLTTEEIAWEFSVIAPMEAIENEGWSTEIELALMPAVEGELQTFTLIADESLASYRVEEVFLNKPDWLERHGLVPGLATATADIQLSDFSMTPPSLLGILTVSEQVALVLDFHLQREGG